MSQETHQTHPFREAHLKNEKENMLAGGKILNAERKKTDSREHDGTNRFGTRAVRLSIGRSSVIIHCVDGNKELRHPYVGVTER
jgi:hypothetical protein